MKQFNTNSDQILLEAFSILDDRFGLIFDQNDRLGLGDLTFKI